MPGSNSDGEDVFFNATDTTDNCARISVDSTIHDECINTSNRNPKSFGFMHSCGPFELSSVHERRSCFFRQVGISGNVSSQTRFNFEPEIDEILEIGRFVPLTRDTVSETPTCSTNSELERDCRVCSRDNHTDKVLRIHDEARSVEVKTFQKFEALNSISEPAHRTLERGLSDDSNNASAGKINIVKRWWSFPAKWKMQTYETPMVDHLQVKEPRRTNVERHRKRCMDFTSLFMDQELRAHKGPIRVVKFSPSGRYLATGGEDSAVKIWEIREVESSFGGYNQRVFSEPKRKPKGIMGIEMLKKGARSGLAIIPKQIFQIVEKPLHKFREHTAGILDLCWSKSDVSHSSYDEFVFYSS
jgi:WD repeat-containing protein 44